MNVVHAATTTKNPLNVWQIREAFLDYAKYNPWYSQVSTPWAYPVSSPRLFRIGVNITETLPLSLMELYANAVGDQKLKKSAT